MPVSLIALQARALALHARIVAWETSDVATKSKGQLSLRRDSMQAGSARC